LEPQLQNEALDLAAAFVVVGRLGERLAREPAAAAGHEVAALEGVLVRPGYREQKQGRFLFQAAADVLAHLAAVHPDPGLGAAALEALERMARGAPGPPHQAACRALGGLPLALEEARPPQAGDEDAPEPLKPADLPRLTWEALARQAGRDPAGAVRWQGRSAVLGGDPGPWLVVKLARRGENLDGLRREVRWMDRLGAVAHRLGADFHVPRLLAPGPAALLRLVVPPPGGPRPQDLHPERVAAAFLASPQYYAYPNRASGPEGLPPSALRETLGRNAWLLARLAARGWLHTDPIPLFHNRAQVGRRPDGGRYDWTRGGRLDRWLDSCRHPNFAVSGLRDFEHLEICQGDGRRRYEVMGAHLLALLLVAGSYFRSRAPERRGTAPGGGPVDARDLFDADLLADLVEELFRRYAAGFAGSDPAAAGPPPGNPRALARRMVEEMGVDRHMEEILRAPDQLAMSEGEFAAHLRRWGALPADAPPPRRGAGDLVLATGPHLGGFNQRISLPEMLDFVAAAAALAAAARFRAERGLPAAG